MTNPWLLSAAALLGAIALAHSLLGEQRIFRTWDRQAPPGVGRYHRTMLRGSWHLPSLLGAAQGAALAWLGLAAAADLPAAPLLQAVLACLGAGVLACGVLVAVLTRGRHHGGTALLLAGGLILAGLLQGAPR